MGLIANYFEAELDLLEDLKDISLEELMEMIEEIEEDETLPVCDIDKTWDGLHFLLTEKTIDESNKIDYLSMFIAGEITLNDEEMIAIIMPDQLKNILEEVNKCNIEEKLKGFDPVKFSEADIYPKIWIEEDRDYLSTELLESFQELKNFYNEVAYNNNGIIVTIL